MALLELFWVGLILQALVLGFFCAYVAGQKGRSGLNWFFLGFFFSVVALLALGAVPRISGESLLAKTHEQHQSAIEKLGITPGALSELGITFQHGLYVVAVEGFGSLQYQKSFEDLGAAINFATKKNRPV